jgi:Rab3 GTPase-activating protein catalytic subunit
LLALGVSSGIQVYFHESGIVIFYYFAGLLSLFKCKIASSLPLEPISVAVRFTYILTDWPSNNIWTQEPPDFDFMQGQSLGVAELGKLPFGATRDPVRQVIIDMWI